MYRAEEAPVRNPLRMNGMVAALTSEAQGLVPSGRRPAGHPQVIMISEPRTVAVGPLPPSWGKNTQDPRPHLLTTQGLCRFPLRLPRGVLDRPPTKSPCPWRRKESQDHSFPTSLEHQLLSVSCSLCLDPTRASKDSFCSQQWTSPPVQA